MAKNPLRRIKLDMAAVRQMDKLYQKIPKIKCKGLCTESCGLIHMSKLEFNRLSIAIQKVFAYKPEDELCPAPRMTDVAPMKSGRSSAASGVSWMTPKMRCPHGCEADSILSDAEARKLIKESLWIGDGTSIPEGSLEYLKRELENPSGRREERETGTQREENPADAGVVSTERISNNSIQQSCNDG